MTAKWRNLLIGGILLLGMAGAIYWWQRPAEPSWQATGTVEATTYEVTSRWGGDVRDLTRNAGDAVKAGDVLATVERPELMTQRDAAAAALRGAQAALEETANGRRPQELRALANKVTRSEALYRKAAADYERYHQLYEQEAIAAQALEHARIMAEVAQAEWQAVQEEYDLAREGATGEQLAMRQAEVDRWRAQLEQAESQAKDTQIISPTDGVILRKSVENNERISAGKVIATVADLDSVTIRIYVASADLALLSLGEEVDVHIDAFPSRRFTGVIEEISNRAEFNPRQSMTSKERANMVFKVKVRVANPEHILKPGMPADVWPR